MRCRRKANVVKEAEKSVCDAYAHEEDTLPINQYNLILLQPRLRIVARYCWVNLAITPILTHRKLT